MKSILFEIRSLERLIFRDSFKDDKSSIVSLPTPSQMMILDYIISSDKDFVFQRDLERVFGLRRATISGILHTMEKNNLIVRSVFEDDSRAKIILLSPKTKLIFDSNKKRLEDLEKVIVNGISDRELFMFLNVLNRMKDNIKNCN